MKLRYSLSLALLVPTLGFSAITISVRSQNAGGPVAPHTTISDSVGSPVPLGNRLLIGTFDVSSGASAADYFVTNGGNLNVLASDFTVFGGDAGGDFALDSRGTESGEISSQPGRFSFSLTGNVEGTPLAGADIYLWVFNTQENNDNLGPGFGNVAEYGIFSASTWNFGISDAPTGSFTIRAQEIDFFAVSNGEAFSLVAVPEPAVLSLLLGTLVLGLASVRRRR